VVSPTCVVLVTGSAWKPLWVSLQTRGRQLSVEDREPLTGSVQTIRDTADARVDTHPSVCSSVAEFLRKPTSLPRNFFPSSARPGGLYLRKMLYFRCRKTLPLQKELIQYSVSSAAT
jgi:hypothetical protein